MIEVGEEEEEREKVRKVPFRPNWVSQKVARLYPACIGSIARRARYSVTAPHSVA